MRIDQPGHRVLLRVITEPDLRFRATVDGYARRYTLDRDDLYQAASERLLRQRGVVPDHEGLRGWLERCVNFTALDMIKDRARQPMVMSDLPEPPDPRPSPATDSVGWEQWLAGRLDRALTRDQVRAVLALVRDPDLGLRELAKVTNKSYAGARQLKSRALAKLGRLIGLTAAERAAYRGLRKGEGVAEAARRLGIDAIQVDRLRRAASVKIRRFLSFDASGSRKQGRA
ncbi:RNA polymerase sigma factor [Kibdelosporangium persicum]|uniref:DNA-directed RNA polymerase specialized sigma subunit, sigma24 family n=1 Tax=Kibdelosporangium persicum TaxID=2698649 RepID=A0ABX2F7Y8_9PSEU|nr:sigma-70 family RNA polymerase sigma factor [Kibdelosporangium persicum]NRN67465.1 DNA-directed RNA polymerase specialized sigma subunit, sigma24 family [Kibdelosporangium persicum]